MNMAPVDPDVEAAFTAFVMEAEPRLRQALVARLGPERGADGVSQEDLARTLWFMARGFCPESFPEGAIEAGPPGL